MLMDALPDRICKNKRYHFYPARKVFLEEATEEEMQQIRYALDTYGTRCELFEYPVVVVDTSGNESGKEGMILTPEHLFYHVKLTAGYLPVASVKKIWGQSGLLNTGLYAESRDGARVKLPYVCDRKELPELGKCLHGFIGYLQEKPESRDVRYLAKEKHRQICCLRCGYRYTDAEGTVCPKCGYKMNQ